MSCNDCHVLIALRSTQQDATNATLLNCCEPLGRTLDELPAARSSHWNMRGSMLWYA